jgi:hypothetical protein
MDSLSTFWYNCSMVAVLFRPPCAFDSSETVRMKKKSLAILEPEFGSLDPEIRYPILETDFLDGEWKLRIEFLGEEVFIPARHFWGAAKKR